MNQRILSVLLFLFASQVYGQTNPQKLFADSIMYHFNSTDYSELKIRFLGLEKEIGIDPSDELLFLGLSVENEDFKFYKRRLKALMRNHGFSYHISDTAEFRRTNKLLDQIYYKGKAEWLSKLSQKHYSYWVRKNPLAHRVQSNIQTLVERDQLAVKLLSPYYHNETVSDSTKNEIKEILFAMGRANIDKLVAICEELGAFPNNYDHGVGSYNALGAILDHSLEAKANFRYAWDQLFPYLERVYLDGKIDHTCFLFYDMHSYFHFGTQRFGFAPPDVPMEDEDSWPERKAKYGL